MGVLASRKLRSCSTGSIVAILGISILVGCDRGRSVTYLPFSAPAFALLADDVNGDGNVDVVLTSHKSNFTQVFLQHSPRSFQPGPRVEEVGFHPGDLLRLPGAEHRYLMFSEGTNRLQVFTPSEDGNLTEIAASAIPTPRTGAIFHWPASGLGIAAASYGKSAIYVLRDFDPATAKAAEVVEVPFRPKIARAENVVSADLDGNGVDDLLFINKITNALSVIRCRDACNTMELEDLWGFDREYRVTLVVSADIDHDGDIDLLVPDASEARGKQVTAIHVLINDGSGAFEQRDIIVPGRSRADGGLTGIRALAFGIDRDKKPYMLAVGYEQMALVRFPSVGEGAQPEIRTVAFPDREVVATALLRDLDGDGWLDAIIARLSDDDGGLVVYGPLWDEFEALTSGDLVPRD